MSMALQSVPTTPGYNDFSNIFFVVSCDVRSLLPVESETDDLQDHIIICGFGCVVQIIAQLLSESLIPFVALDVRRYVVIINYRV
ncbi:hypothetical protein L2E82_13377 [Cichorium intybus]|uniref:Uncharacterized protein n=1 Tax=Cichorium intybus TaxID=13427 RepID=A0ACB9EXD6_CICIN|nr:hypothetical protein L2E82_13377 [Cichorium intybus]